MESCLDVSRGREGGQRTRRPAGCTESEPSSGAVALGQAREHLFGERGERKVSKLLRPRPLVRAVAPHAKAPALGLEEKDVQPEIAVREDVPNDAERRLDGALEPQRFVHELLGRAGPGRPAAQFRRRELPEPAQEPLLGALHEEHLVSPLDDRAEPLHHRHLPALAAHRIAIDPALLSRLAGFLQGAQQAGGVVGQADERAQLHERLVPVGAFPEGRRRSARSHSACWPAVDRGS